MTNQTLRRITLYLSICLFLGSLTQKAYCTSDSCGDSIMVFILGPFAVLLGGAGFTWLANPLLIFAWIVNNKHPKMVMIASLLSTVIAISFLTFHQIIEDEAGNYRQIISYKLGYWLWVASAATMLFGTVVNYIRTKIQLMTKTISKSNLPIYAMPDTYETTSINIELTAPEYQAALIGSQPKGTDDRWFMYANDGWLNLHRSWTGHCIFRLKIEILNEGCLLTELQVNRDFDQYKSTNIEADKIEAESVARSLITRNVV